MIGDSLISVHAEMKRKNGERGHVIFTEFFEDGTCLQPPIADMDRLNTRPANRSFLESIQDRMFPVLVDTEQQPGHSECFKVRSL